MLYYDMNNPNKYNGLKKRLQPIAIDSSFLRIGDGDGSYVLTNDILDHDINILSYGIGSNIPFEESASDIHDAIVHCYDSNINVDTNNPRIIFHKENLKSFSQFKTHCEKMPLLINEYSYNVLKMDIEGCEWNFFNEANMGYIFLTFDFICLEFHGLIEEVPEGWVIEDEIQKAKNNLKLKCDVLDKINDYYDLIHLHANNHGPRYIDFPDSLEVTYQRTNPSKEIEFLNSRFPIEGLDYPNYEGREDYVLDWWVDYYG